MTTSMRSTRGWFGLAGWLAMGAVVSGAHDLDARSFSAPNTTSRALSDPADSAATHRELRKAIERFQDRWRSEWQRAELDRHPMINLTQIRGWFVNGKGRIEPPVGQGDRAAMNMTPELRRYLAILCFIDSPSDRQIEFAKANYPDRVPLNSRNSVAPEPTGGNAPAAALMIEPQFGVNPAGISRRIHDAKGSVCPQWLADENDVPLDEGESIDLALPLSKRRDIARERELLLEKLEQAQAAFPNDTWITGQRLRFAIDQRRPAQVLAAAQDCKGNVVYCSRLVALAYDVVGNLELADSVNRMADSLERAAQPADTTFCADADALLLVSKEDSARVREQSCAEQRQFIDRLWWMADPLWSVPGNERLVAHRSRQTQLALRSALNRDERYVWSVEGGGRGLRAMLMRYGWPSYTYWPGGMFEEEINKYREVSPTVWVLAPPYTSKEYAPDRQSTIPTFAAINAPLLATPADWQTTAPTGTPVSEWWPREHMNLWTTLLPLPDGQRVVLRRDSAVLLAAAIDDPIGGNPTDAEVLFTATLMGSTAPTDMRVLVQTTIMGNQALRFQTAIPSAPLVLSHEVRDLDSRGPTFRSREGFTPPSTLSEMTPGSAAISTPVFVRLPEGVVDAPADPDSAIALMTGSLTLPRSDGIAVYWESYGFAPGDTVDVRLRVIRDERAGLARAIGERLGVIDDRNDSVTVSWREPDNRKSTPIVTRTVPALARSVLLNLRQLPVGPYRLSIEMTRSDGLRTQGEQRFRLRE